MLVKVWLAYIGLVVTLNAGGDITKLNDAVLTCRALSLTVTAYGVEVVQYDDGVPVIDPVLESKLK